MAIIDVQVMCAINPEDTLTEFLHQEFSSIDAAKEWIEESIFVNRNDILQFGKYPIGKDERIEILLLNNHEVLDYWKLNNTTKEFKHFGVAEYYAMVAGRDE